MTGRTPHQAIRVAYGSIPKDCGTFTFYRNLRESLAPRGIELYCVTVGAREALYWNPAFADDHCVLLAADSRDDCAQARAFVEWAGQERIQLLMPINSTALLAALPHLPAEIQAVMRCANAYEHGYRITVLGQKHAAAIVATTPRHTVDLLGRYGADKSKLTMIPHGIDPGPYDDLPPRQRQEALTLGYLGRLEHRQKGALYLPGIVRELERRGVPFHLKIAGVGEHGPALERLLSASVARGAVEFVGRLTPREVPRFFAGIDLFLFPSRFEGFGFSLVEAMMAGCVPVVSRIAGITDFIICEGFTGLLCEIGDEPGFAEAIAGLHLDRDKLEECSAATAIAARGRFRSARMASDYATLFQQLVASPVPKPAPLPWSQFRLPEPLRPTWRSRVPKPVRRFLRPAAAMAGMASRGFQ